MRIETYRGVKLKVKKGCEWGTLAHYVNGVRWGDWLGTDEDKALASMRSYVDSAIEQPSRWADYWQPGYQQPKRARDD